MAGTLTLLLTISKDKYIYFIIFFVEWNLEGTYMYLSSDWHKIVFICELLVYYDAGRPGYFISQSCFIGVVYSFLTGLPVIASLTDL